MNTFAVRGLGLIALAASLTTAAPSFAAGEWSGCFQKIYDPAHMAAHRRQTVTSLTVRLTPMKSEPPWISQASFYFTLRGRRTRYLDTADCDAKAGGGLNCGMDEDAGIATLTRSGANLVVTVNQTLRLTHGSQAQEDSTGPYIQDSNAEDRTFVLKPAPASVCR